jgi:hypothetical protein
MPRQHSMCASIRHVASRWPCARVAD